VSFLGLIPCGCPDPGREDARLPHNFGFARVGHIIMGCAPFSRSERVKFLVATAGSASALVVTLKEGLRAER
jgi:hypothetical protein